MKPPATVTDTNQIVGYAYTFEEQEVSGGPAAEGWIERIMPGAFTAPKNVALYLNNNRILALTKDGSLTITEDDIGVKVVATPPGNAWTRGNLRAIVNRGFRIGMAFFVKEQSWSTASGFNKPYTYRLITKLQLVNLSIEAL